MKPFLVCIHDATPAFAAETEALIAELAPMLGRRLSIGVVPNWHGVWPLAAHASFCELVQQSAEELLLHGYVHERRRGWGPVSLLTEGSDEMNGLNREETRDTLQRGQCLFVEAFGQPARGFLAPAWQAGHFCCNDHMEIGLEFALGFFSLMSPTRKASLATWTWDCGRWGRLGFIGHLMGSLLHSLGRRVPVLAIHPRDLDRGFGRQILCLTEELLAAGYKPSTSAGLLETLRC